MFELTLSLAVLLCLAAFVAGFVDSIAGGGGLITLPALLLAGVPPTTALATNKVQGAFGAGAAALSYAKSGQVRPATQLWPAAMAGGASFFGALLVSILPTGKLELFLPVLLIAIALFFAFKPGLGDVDRQERLSPRLFALTAVPAIGFYDGLLGPGAGAFYMLAFVMLAGFGILRATAHTKLLNFASNIGALCAFAAVARPMWGVGLAMGAAQMAGAFLGAKVAVRVGARVIKPLLVITSLALAVRLIIKAVSP